MVSLMCREAAVAGRMHYFTSLLIICLTLTSVKSFDYGTAYKALLSKFRATPHVNAIPPTAKNASEPSLHLIFQLYQIVGISDTGQTATIKIRMQAIWYDRRLAYGNSSNRKDFVNMSFDKVWHPVLITFQTLSSQRITPPMLQVYPDGLLKLTDLRQLTVTFPMELHAYPFDRQVLSLAIACSTCSRRGKATDVNIRNTSDFRVGLLPVKDRLAMKENNMFEVSGIRHRLDNFSSPGKLRPTFLRVDIHMHRKFTYHVFYLFLPSIIITLASYIQFLMPAEGEKVSIGLTCLLSITVFMLVVHQNVAADPMQTLPLMGWYVAGHVLIILTNTILSAIAVRLHSEGIQCPAALGRELVLQQAPGPLVLQITRHALYITGGKVRIFDALRNELDMNAAMCNKQNQVEAADRTNGHHAVHITPACTGEDMLSMVRASWSLVGIAFNRVAAFLMILAIVAFNSAVFISAAGFLTGNSKPSTAFSRK